MSSTKSRVIEDYETLNITQHLGNGKNEFNVNILHSVIADEMILKYITIYNTNQGGANAPKIYKIKTDLLQGNQTLLTFPKSTIYNESVDIPFNRIKNSNGDFRFTILDGSEKTPGNLPTFDMDISLTLIFVKYKYVG